MIVTLSVLLIITAIGMIYYWADFFIRGTVQLIKEDWYIKFERAFAPADLWTSVCALLGAAGLLTGETYGLVFALITAGSLLFLAFMDVTFNIQNKLYPLVATSNQMRFEVLINVWTLALGTALIVLLWPRVALL